VRDQCANSIKCMGASIRAGSRLERTKWRHERWRRPSATERTSPALMQAGYPQIHGQPEAKRLTKHRKSLAVNTGATVDPSQFA
jgi:hypothetical protein